jgi:hypothetical protein
MSNIIIEKYNSNDPLVINKRNSVISEVYNFLKSNILKLYLDELDKEITIKYHNIIFHIYYCEKKDKIDFKCIKRLLKRCYIITKAINKTFTIHLILSPLLKKFNIDNKPLSPINCNTGFTYLQRNNNNNNNNVNIYIIRKEEYAKVILHEIIHHIDKIHSSFSQSNINRLKHHFKIASVNVDANECIVEFWATIFHLYQISIEYNQDFYKLFQNELKYSLYKSYQLLTLQKQMTDGYWIETSNSYSYIIFKTIIMYNLLEFQKIYTFPYNDTIITDFLIKFSKLPMNITTNPSKIRENNSLCFMLYSDK